MRRKKNKKGPSPDSPKNKEMLNVKIATSPDAEQTKKLKKYVLKSYQSSALNLYI